MAGLLRAGHTMLNLACPLCNNPLFRNKENDIFCPICNKKVIIKKEDSLANEGENSIKSEDRDQNSKHIVDKQQYYNPNTLIKIIENKINMITQKLEHETQMVIIERYVKTLTRLFDLLKKVNNFNASAGI